MAYSDYQIRLKTEPRPPRRTTEFRVAAEAGLRPERAATINPDFASHQEALQYFLRATNITDARTYFADLSQGILPFPNEEPTQ